MTKAKRSGSKPLSSIELFTGAGGLALGTDAAGFRHEMLVELDRNACATLRLNHKRFGVVAESLEPTNVCDVAFSPFADKLDLIAAGVPCQPFSLGGKHRGHADDRNLFPQLFRAVCEAQPKALLIENVKGLLRQSFAPYFEYILLRLGRPCDAPRTDEHWESHKARLLRDADKTAGDIRYDVIPQLVNCADYGVPQKRERVFIVAFRSDLNVAWRPPAQTHSSDALLHAKWVDGSYWKRHELPQPATPRHLEGHLERLSSSLFPPRGEAWHTVRDAIGALPKPMNGKEHPDCANHVGNPGARSYPGHTGSSWDEPAKTLKAGDHGVPGGENMLRYENGQVRYFTAREAARIQSFPDDFVFAGPWTECLRQLGNAVPVEAAQVFAGEIAKCLKRASSRARDAAA